MKRHRESSSAAVLTETAPKAAVNVAAKRILVVDDDDSVREMLPRVLTGEGYQVWAAADGTAALEMAAAVKFDLVLLDLNLPGKSGWDTFEALTARDPLLATIIITARSNQLDDGQGRRRGRVAGKAAGLYQAAGDRQRTARGEPRGAIETTDGKCQGLSLSSGNQNKMSESSTVGKSNGVEHV